MTSALAKRLMSEIDRAGDADERAIKTAHLACYLARIGDFEQAETIKTQLRGSYGDGRNIQVSVLIMTLEGLLLYFKSLNPGARDRFARAELLSRSFGQDSLVALTASWLAHIDFNLCRYESMASSIATALDRLEYDDGSANCRVSLVLGDAFLFCNHGRESQTWYERARRAYTHLGDQASIGAITYNRAALRASNLRLSSLDAATEPGLVSAIALEVNSAINYQALVRSRSLDHLLRSARVGINMVAGNFAEADSEIDQLLGVTAVPVDSPEQVILLADKAECRARLGAGPNAISLVEQVLATGLDDLQADDRALALNSLSNACRLLEDNTRSVELRLRADEALESHKIKIMDVSKLIERFSNPSDFPEPVK